MRNHSAKIFVFYKVIEFEDHDNIGSLFHLNFRALYFFIYF